MIFEFYEEKNFKNTEIGELPVDWEVARLKEIGEFINGYAFKPLQWESQGKPIIRIQNLNDEKKPFNYYSGELPDKYLVKKGDILISWSASLGVYIWNKEEAWLNQHIYKVVIKTNIHRDYLFYSLLNTFKEQAGKHLHGTTMKHIVREKFLNIPIPLPPLQEQKAIARVLHAVQSAREATEKVINATKELKKSLMKHLFTYGPVSVDEIEKVPLKKTKIGLIPQHWEVVRLGDVAKIKQGKALPKSKFTATGYPVFGANGRIGFYSEYTHENSEVLVTCRGSTCGEINICPPKSFVTNNAMVVTPLEDILLKEFLAYSLKYFRVDQAITGSGQPQITKAQLSMCLIPLPPLQEQKAIANILKTTDQKIQKEEQRKKALENLFKSLLSQLMTGKIRIKIL